MSGGLPETPGTSHKAAAIALWVLSTIVGLGIYFASRPSQARMRECIDTGNPCNEPFLATAAIFIVIGLGWSFAARAWRGR